MIVTGGGPGLMEAANLGAFLAPYSDTELDAALAKLSAAKPGTNPQAFMDWIETAMRVREGLLGGDWTAAPNPESVNLGIPDLAIWP